jgi:long-chain acyl-CoA synthetase
MISGGAALPSSVEAFWDRLGYAVIQGYGLTETTSLVSVNHPFRLGKGSIGKVLPGLEVKLDAGGEILVRGENIAAGYWRERRLEPVAGEDGWFHTGDLGEIDAQGNLYFKGRLKNVIVTPAGMNVYPEDLEAALRREPEVRDCVVVGVSQDGNAEPCAVLLLRDPGANAQQVIEKANRALAEYQRIRQWLVWPGQDFPRTPTQKPRLPEIEKAIKERMGAATAALPDSDAFAGLVARIARHAGQAAVSPETRLDADLNLSSVDRVELLSALEARYQVDLNETQFSEVTTVGELEKLIREPLVPRRRYTYPRWAQRWPITWVRRAIYYLLVWPATYLLAAPRVHGCERLRDVRGPVLVISNHITMVDVGFILAALPARLRHHLAVAMGGERLWAMRHPPAEMNLFRRWLERVKYALVVALFNVFPLPRQSGYRESFDFAGESVDRGYNVLVFPEGDTTHDGRMAPFRAGIGLLATRLDLPVVPMRIDGLFELREASKRFARPGKVRVTIGEPVRYSPDQEASEIAGDLERRVEALGSTAAPSGD